MWFQIAQWQPLRRNDRLRAGEACGDHGLLLRSRPGILCQPFDLILRLLGGRNPPHQSRAVTIISMQLSCTEQKYSHRPIRSQEVFRFMPPLVPTCVNCVYECWIIAVKLVGVDANDWTCFSRVSLVYGHETKVVLRTILLVHTSYLSCILAHLQAVVIPLILV